MLRDYQIDIIERLREAWQTHRSVMVQMPTGTGKTHVLAAIVRGERRGKSEERRGKNEEGRVKSEESYSNETCVWIIAHRRELVAQIEETLGRYGIKTEDGREDEGKGRIRVMSIQWLSRHWEDVKHKPELIVIDEAHHAQARTYRMLWDRYPNARFLGLTATPCRMSRSGFTDLFDTLICSWSTAEFIEKGVLSAFDYVSIRPGSEEQRIIDSLEKRGADGDYQVKEMSSRLNRQQSIRRLHESITKYAWNKKGIVYAINIEHARNIAAYYSKQGTGAVAIDSRTPAAERKRLVSEFKAGEIKVLVNVDVFSEGFDCPDVEFVQMARPTLSLSKYLQQVGRGLRKTESKEACVLIDNVGLYRVFGLPTVAWDWQAIFQGELSGKGTNADKHRGAAHTEVMPTELSINDDEMEMVVAHDELLSRLHEINGIEGTPSQKKPCMRAWQDKESGLWGLRSGHKRITAAVFLNVFDIRYDMAAVRLTDKSCALALIKADGEIIWTQSRCTALRFVRNHFAIVRTTDGKEHYIDLFSLRTYDNRPEIKRYGNIELLKVGRAYYSRTRNLYVNNQNINSDYISRHGFYITILDYKPCCTKVSQTDDYRWEYVCLLESDNDSYYWINRRLADGSIIVTDPAGLFYHVTANNGKKNIGHCGSADEEAECRKEIDRISRLAVETLHAAEAAKEERKRQLLDRQDGATPFRSGTKWGLKVGNIVTVPPVYRSIKSPVGKYCAVEKNYSQWGVVALDGTLVIEPQYSDIEINAYGAVTGTKVTGNKVHLQLP